MSSTLALRRGGSTTPGPDPFRGLQTLVVVLVSVFTLLFAVGSAAARPTGVGQDTGSSDSHEQQIADVRALNAPAPGAAVAGDAAAIAEDVSSIDISAVAPFLFVLVGLIVVFWLALDWRKPTSV